MEDFNIIGIDLGDEISMSSLLSSESINIQCYNMMMSEETINRLGIEDKFQYINLISNAIINQIVDTEPLMVILSESNTEMDTVLKCYLENCDIDYMCITEDMMEEKFNLPKNKAILKSVTESADKKFEDENGFLTRSVILSVYGLSMIFESQDVLRQISEEADL